MYKISHQKCYWTFFFKLNPLNDILSKVIESDHNIL